MKYRRKVPKVRKKYGPETKEHEPKPKKEPKHRKDYLYEYEGMNDDHGSSSN